MSYVYGFGLAVILTLIAYGVVVNEFASGSILMVIVMTLAVLQLVAQLVFFLHFGKGKAQKWNTASFYFMLLILVVIVGGSLWIMANMNYNMMMTPEQMNEHMLQESTKGF